MTTKRLIVATTVPETLSTILKGQPKFLGRFFEVHLVTSSGPELPKLVAEGIPVHIVAMKRGISPIQDIVSIVEMFHLFRSIGPDIVHSYTPKAGLVCMLAAWLSRVPVRVHTFTGLVWPTAAGAKRLLLKIIDRVICYCATNVIPEGLGVKLDLTTGSITSKPLDVIGYGNVAGVDLSHFILDGEARRLSTELRSQYAIADSEFVFLFVGRLNRDKGLKELLIAFEEVPQDARLFIVGAVDTTSPIDEITLRKIEVHPRVHWLGFRDDVRIVLAAADALILPSYREGFPNVILEAGAMERVVIASDISGCNEVIDSGVNGWLVPPRNPKKLEEAMLIAMYTDRQTLEDMGRSARLRVAERYDRISHWHRMVSFYEAVSG